MDIFKFLVPVLLAPTNYNEVLKKLAAFLFYDTLIATFLLRGIPQVNGFFENVEHYKKIGEVLSVIPNYSKLNLLGVIISLLIAGLGYMFQLHDKISDLFGIRSRFDRHSILLPLAVLTGTKLSPIQLNTLRSSRDTIMRQVFYRYTSSKADKPLVDKHDIEQALGAWSWYWVLVEGIVIFLATALTAFFFSAPQLGLYLVFFVMICWLLADVQFKRLESYARPQIEAIAANAEAAKDVKDYLSAI